MLSSRLNSKAARGFLMAALLGGTALAGFVTVRAATAETSAPIAPAITSPMLPDFTGLVAHVRPAVVSITVELKPQTASDDSSDDASPFGQMGPHHGQPVQARGSGFISRQMV